MRQSHPLLEEIDAPALASAMAGDDPPLLVDVRTDPERAAAAIEPSLHIGLDRFVERAPAEIPMDRDVVVYCHVGACLLYTSPSPRDRSVSRMPSSA